MNPNIVKVEGKISREQREFQNGHRSTILWFTGLSGSGKSTVTQAVDEQLHRMGYRTFVLDGDNIRKGLCSDLGFSSEDRMENIRRIGEVAKLFLDAGVIVLVAFISPFRKDRDRVRTMTEAGEFFEVFCKCPLQVCESRDPKGLYAKARAGEIKNFTGISSPYEEPEHPDLILKTDIWTIEECIEQVLELISKKDIIRPECSTP